MYRRSRVSDDDEQRLFDGLPFDRDGPVPLFEQLKGAILRAIEEGRLGPNDRLPSEQELSLKLGISRMTIHRAFLDLVHQGLLFTRPGKGTFVQGRKVEQLLTDLQGFSADIHAQGRRISSRILEAAIQVATPELINRMELDRGDEVVLLDRIRLVDDEPVARERVYLPHRLVPGLLQHDLERGSLFQTLRNLYGRGPHHAEETLTVIRADREIAQLLEISPGDPIFYMERTTWLADHRVIEYGLSWRRGDRCRYRVHIGNRPPVFTLDVQSLDATMAPASG